uniref:Uncharacterized protein n=2 Tax=Parascaris univalens TaxID=6257 RepID=A0A915CK59_PARUN
HFIRQEKTPAKRKYNWLEPSKTNGYGGDNLPRPVPIRPLSMSAPEISRPRTKQSEKAKLQARREALRDTNLSVQYASGVTARASPFRLPKREFLDEELRARSKSRDPKGRFIRRDETNDFEVREEMLETKSVSKRGRKLIKRKFSLSPSPPKTPVKNTSPNKRTTTTTPNKRRNSSSPQKISPQIAYSSMQKTLISPQKSFINGIQQTPKPISALDSTSFFARGIAARLYVVKAESPSEYANVCQKINEILSSAESALNINSIGD